MWPCGRNGGLRSRVVHGTWHGAHLLLRPGPSGSPQRTAVYNQPTHPRARVCVFKVIAVDDDVNDVDNGLLLLLRCVCVCIFMPYRTRVSPSSEYFHIYAACTQHTHTFTEHELTNNERVSLRDCIYQ